MTISLRFPGLAIGVGMLVVAVACGGGVSSPPLIGNLFENPGFENGRDPWFSLKPPDFVLSESLAHSGDASALLLLRGEADEEGARIAYLVQEIEPQELPQVLSGNYRVENWTKGTEKQYLQFVVIVFGADNLPGGYPNHQIRYILSGIDSEPFPIANARFLFLTREKDPSTGKWIAFDREVAQDFQDLWGEVPKGFDEIRVLFEVRYDDKSIGDGAAAADVYYDDLFFGPSSSQ